MSVELPKQTPGSIKTSTKRDKRGLQLTKPSTSMRGKVVMNLVMANKIETKSNIKSAKTRTEFAGVALWPMRKKTCHEVNYCLPLYRKLLSYEM